MATAREINDLVIKRMKVVGWKPQQPRLVDGDVNPDYVALCGEFIEGLGTFEPDVIRVAMDGLIQEHKYPGWPFVSVVHSACAREQAKRRPPDVPKLYSPNDRDIPEAERLQCSERLRRLMQAMKYGHTDGTPWGKDGEKDRAWAYEGKPAKSEAA